MSDKNLKSDDNFRGEESNKAPDVFELSRFKDGERINFQEIVTILPKSVREKISSGYDIKKFAKIFEDEEMMLTVNTFLSSGMNVSETARKLYMHRNTLIYRLGVIDRQTGLDLHDFEMAVTFKLLHYLYILK